MTDLALTDREDFSRWRWVWRSPPGGRYSTGKNKEVKAWHRLRGLNARPQGLKFRIWSRIQLSNQDDDLWENCLCFCPIMVMIHHPTQMVPSSKCSPGKLQGAATFSLLGTGP